MEGLPFFIAIAEILTREGHSVVLVEKNKKLASVATREFHEWVPYWFVIHFSKRSNENIKIYIWFFR